MNYMAYREGPYYYADEGHKRQRTAGGKQFTLILSSAFNAYGLIGPECNGIVVLNDTDMNVVLDEECRNPSGAPTKVQIMRFEAMLTMPDDEFLDLCRNHLRYRPRSLGEPLPDIPIDFDFRNDVSYDDEAKFMWHRAAHDRFQAVANRLGLKPDEYDLRHNQGGVAVSGEVTLHTDHFYMQISQGTSDLGILYRECNGRNDYSGGRNQWMPIEMMNTPNAIADRLRMLTGVH